MPNTQYLYKTQKEIVQEATKRIMDKYDFVTVMVKPRHSYNGKSDFLVQQKDDTYYPYAKSLVTAQAESMYAHLLTNNMVREINKNIRRLTTKYEIKDLDKKISSKLIPNPIDGNDAYHPVNAVITI